MKDVYLIPITDGPREEWHMWMYPGGNSQTYTSRQIYHQMPLDFPQGTTIITASEFPGNIVDRDIQVKEGIALLKETPEQIKGTNVVSNIDNQAQ